MILNLRKYRFLPIHHVYGVVFIGNGKSHYIRSEMDKLQNGTSITIAVNESFSVQKCIQKLNDASSAEVVPSFAIHLNFTIPYLEVI